MSLPLWLVVKSLQETPLGSSAIVEVGAFHHSNLD